MFIGFSGVDKVHTYVSWIIQLDKEKEGFAFNVLVFILFLVAILHLVFQFGRKQADAERAIVTITNVINQGEDLIARSEAQYRQITDVEFEMFRQKYDGFLPIIPPKRVPHSSWFWFRSLDLLGMRSTGSAFRRTAQTPRNRLNLSGAVRQLDKVFLPRVRVFVPSILTRSLPVLQRRLRSGESCSTASRPDARTTRA